MIEIIGTAPDWSHFAQAATATNLTDDKGTPLSGGVFSVGGSWFYNAVGTVYEPTGNTVTDTMGNPAPEMAPLPGVWARVRFNGEVPTLSQMISVWRANGVTVYERVTANNETYWSADGVTKGPAYLDNIGVIA